MTHNWPERWVESNLETIVSRMTNGANLKQVDEQKAGFLPISRIETIANEDIDFERVKYVEADEKSIEKYKLLKGDVLFSHINSDKHLGKTAYFDCDQTLLHGINLLLIRAVDEYDGKLLNYLFRHYRFKGGFIEVAQRSVNQSSINQKKLKSFPVPIIPLPEQKRIVAKLDALFGHLDTLREKLDRIPELLKNFRQQVLTQAVTGKLTEEWRKKNPTKKWETRKLSDLAESITDGDHQAPPRTPEGIPFLVISNVSSGTLDIENATRFVPQHYYDSLKDSRKPQIGDILYTVTGSIGIPVLVNRPDRFTFQRHIAIIKPDQNKVDTGYLLAFLQSPESLEQGRKVAKGTAQLTIPLGGLRNYIVPLPSISEQRIIAEKVTEIFHAADKIEAQYQNLKEKIDSLPQAILSKAFKGELVPQNENDEPAGVLLERIKGEKTGKVYKGKEELRMVAEGKKQQKNTGA